MLVWIIHTIPVNRPESGGTVPIFAIYHMHVPLSRQPLQLYILNSSDVAKCAIVLKWAHALAGYI